MSYIQKDLLDGERIVYTGKLHWCIFFPAFFYMLLSIFLLQLAHKSGMPAFILLGGVASLYAFMQLIKAFVIKLSTELAVTNKRVIFKKGLISRDTMELNHSKIESIVEDQSIIGRIFNYGTLVIQGTGGGKEYLRNIANPLTFKKQAQSAADTVSNPAKP